MTKPFKLQKAFICPACGKRLASYENYKAHYAENHLPKVKS